MARMYIKDLIKSMLKMDYNDTKPDGNICGSESSNTDSDDDGDIKSESKLILFVDKLVVNGKFSLHFSYCYFNNL